MPRGRSPIHLSIAPVFERAIAQVDATVHRGQVLILTDLLNTTDIPTDQIPALVTKLRPLLKLAGDEERKLLRSAIRRLQYARRRKIM